MEADRSETQVDDEEAETMEHPLFMTGLPKNFAANAALSALGSLLEDNEQDDTGDQRELDEKGIEDSCTEHDPPKEEASKRRRGMEIESTHKANAGGGKARRMKTASRRLSSNAPYAKKKAPQTKAKTAPSIGESTLYLKLWKL